MGNMTKEKIIKQYNDRIETGYYNDNNVLILHSFEDEPALIYDNGDKFWFDHGKTHRERDLPAIMYINGSKFWSRYGVKHRGNNLPASIYRDGDKLWFDHGVQYWVIENQRYNILDEVHEKYKDKIIKLNFGISEKLTDMNIDFIYLGWKNDYHNYLILNDTDRNEVILKYG